jgi:hypothetical protein
LTTKARKLIFLVEPNDNNIELLYIAGLKEVSISVNGNEKTRFLKLNLRKLEGNRNW